MAAPGRKTGRKISEDEKKNTPKARPVSKDGAGLFTAGERLTPLSFEFSRR